MRNGLVNKILDKGKNVSKKIHRNLLIGGLSALISVMPVVYGCGGGGGGESTAPTPTPVEDISFTQTNTTDAIGTTNFSYETGSATINTIDQNKNPISDIDVEFWHRPNTDGKGFELYAAKDLHGQFAFLLYPEPHNSEWDVTGFPVNELPIVNVYLKGSEQYDTTNKTVEEIIKNKGYSNATLSELENSLSNTLTTGLVIGSGNAIYNFVTNNFKDVESKIPELSGSDNYLVFTGIPDSVSGGVSDGGILFNMKTIARDNNKNGIADYMETSAPPTPPPQQCTDADHDGYFAEDGCGTAVDPNDNDPNVPQNNPTIKLVFVSRNTGTDQIYTLDSNKAISPSPLIDLGNYYAITPAWVGGDMIAFESNKDAFPEGRNNTEELYLYNLSNKTLTRFTNNNDFDASPSAPANGGWIAFITGRWGNYEVARENIDGSGLTRLTNTPEDELDVSVSPGGNSMGVSRMVGNLSQIRVIDANNGNDIGGVNSSFYDSHPAIASDGSIAFDRLMDNGYRQIVVSKNGAETTITSGNYNHWRPRWNKDGSKLTYFTDESGWNIDSANKDGSGLEHLTTDSSTNYDPAWNPTD